MSEVPERDPLLLDHDADGITELDNKLPGWWLWLFYITIAFGVVYMGYYHVFDVGALTTEKYDNEIAAAKEKFPEAFQTVDVSAGADLAPSTDVAVFERGKEIFDANCVACHTADGGGLIGPNMCDDYFIHGGTYADSVRIINNGVVEKGMIAWKAVLKPSDIEAVASFVYRLRGTTPANPKAPEGEQYVMGQ